MVGGSGPAIHLDTVDPARSAGKFRYKSFVFRSRGCKNQTIDSHAPWEALFFVLLMERHAQYFDFCNASTVKRSKKNVLISLEGWSNSKYCLFPSVRMTFFCASYGAPRSFFHTLTRLYGEMRTFSRGVNWGPFLVTCASRKPNAAKEMLQPSTI